MKELMNKSKMSIRPAYKQADATVKTAEKRMNILVACEESQAVTKELRNLGHNAFSCDIMECSGGHDEWHIMGDVIPLLNGNCDFDTVNGDRHVQYGKWDMIIAFPPCTDLCVSGARHFARKIADGTQQKSIDFFMNFANADCDKIAIENPVGIMSSNYKKPNQIIHPWMFGDGQPKKTCLWLNGLERLECSVTEPPEMEYVEWEDRKTGKNKRQPKWYFDALKLKPKDRAKVRSKTFPGIAKAMAEQWAGKVE